MAPKISTVVLKVDLDCASCCKKIKKTLSKFCVIRSQVFDEEQKTVTISGPFDPEKLMKKICCKAGDVIIGYEIKPDPPPAPKPAPPPPKPEAPKPAPPPPKPEAPKPAPPPPKPEAPKPAPPPPKPEAPKPAPPPPKPEAPKPAPPPPNPDPVVGLPPGSMYLLPVPIGPGPGCSCRSYHGYDWNKGCSCGGCCAGCRPVCHCRPCCDRRCPTCGNYVCGWDYFTEESSSCKPM